VARRVSGGDPKEVLQGLFEGASGYTGNASSDALVAMGAEAVPVILEKIADTRVISDIDKSQAIWVLVRIGVLTPEISDALW